VAVAADDQGLAPSHRHEVHPGRFVRATGLGQVRQPADVVNLTVTWKTVRLPGRRFPVFQVERAALPDDGLGHEQPDRLVDRPAMPGDPGVGVLGSDLVAEEMRRLAGGVGDQRF